MNYAAGLVVLGVIALLYVLYRIARNVFSWLFVVMCVHAYLLLIDRVFPSISLLRIVNPMSACSNQTISPSPSLPPINLETLTQISDTIVEQVPQGWWKEWGIPFISSSAPSSSSPPQSSSSSSLPQTDKPKASTTIDDEFEAYRKWKQAQDKKDGV